MKHILFEDFFDEEEIDVELDNDLDIINQKKYKNTLTIYIDKKAKVNTDYLKKCLSHVKNIDFSDQIKVGDADDVSLFMEIGFNSNISSIDEMKNLFILLYKSTFGNVQAMHFDDNNGNMVMFLEQSTKRLMDVLIHPEDVCFDRKTETAVMKLDSLYHGILYKNGTYSQKVMSNFSQISVKFNFPEYKDTFIDNARTLR